MGKPNTAPTTEIEPDAADLPPEVLVAQSQGNDMTSDELGRLRDILFGSQSRTLDKRLANLETDLRSSQDELTNLLHDQVGRLSEATSSQFADVRREFSSRLEKQGMDQSSQLRATQKDLSERLDRQSAEQTTQLQTAQKQLNDSLDNLAADLLRQIRESHKELSDRLDSLAAEQAERVRNLQTETRQRDENLRQELLSTASSLEGKKTSRQDLGQMLMELGLRLRQDPEKF